MRRVGFITHPDCDLHDCPGHPESSIRTTAIKQHFDYSGLAGKLMRLKATPAGEDQVLLTHSADYLNHVRSLTISGVGFLDPDTYVTRDSYRAALLSYGGGLLAVDKVMTGEIDRAFCCLRPPGHHAGYDYSKGFCIFNNAAGAARYARQKHGVDRISIIDFDGHHGNGTQEIFYSDPAVHYTSLHEYPYYPGTGAPDERGRGAGVGFNLNLALPAGTTGEDALSQIRRFYLPVMRSFRPELILVSAGFDAHRDDPLVGLDFRTEDYYDLTVILSDLADEYADGRIVSLLEGGYDFETLTRSAEAHVKGLLKDD